MGKKLYVGNMSYDVNSSDLEQMFGEHGTVESAKIIIENSTGRSKGFGFVEMSSDEEAHVAMLALDGKDCGGRELKVNEARPQVTRDGGNRSNRGRY
jgi:cold-inducible RNA-binding protein